jgi:hypothetical protein
MMRSLKSGTLCLDQEFFRPRNLGCAERAHAARPVMSMSLRNSCHVLAKTTRALKYRGEITEGEHARIKSARLQSTYE